MILSSARRFLWHALSIAALALMAACGPAPMATGISDPYEASNRATHEFNKKVDRNLLSPAGNGYVSSLPRPVITGIGNVADNLSTPAMMVNSALQVRPEATFGNFWRFAINSTIGIVGIFDVASAMGIPEYDTDFGETLHVWGVPEGNYVELPVFGPSTERDTVGRVVDLFTNPLSYALDSPERYVGPVASVAKRVGDRGRYGQTVDSVLHDSADSYAQARLTYLQSRRYELGGTPAASGDPYDDPYGDPYDAAADSYDDPYTDPYADPYQSTGDPYDDPYLQ